MTFNIWYGGTQVDFGQVARSIRRADADIVGSRSRRATFAAWPPPAGLPHVDESLHLISRYPLFAVERDGLRLAYAALDLDHVVAIANLHLTCCPYGPEEVRGRQARRQGAGPRAIAPAARDPARIYGPCSRSPAAARPTFLTGDFNSPSHLDWTAAMARRRSQTRALSAGLARVHGARPSGLPRLLPRGPSRSGRRSGPHLDPGHAPSPHPQAGDGDRIDWVMAAGPAARWPAKLVGESGGPDVEVGVSPLAPITARSPPPFAVNAARRRRW